MNSEQVDSDFLSKIDFLQDHLLSNDNNNFFDEDDQDDEETREFLLLEQTLQQENDEEPLFNILRKQVEEISIAINDEQKQDQQNKDLEKNEDELNLKSIKNFQIIEAQSSVLGNQPIILRQKKKISFDENYRVNEASHNMSHLKDYSDQEMRSINRPLTIYIPTKIQDLNLLSHLTTLGHDIDSFKQQIQLTPNLCTGYLWRECSNSENNWRKRYFVFDRTSKLFMYFKSLKHYYKRKDPKDVVCFGDIKNVYPDHSRNIRNVEKVSRYYANFSRIKFRSIFIVKSNKRDFVLSTFSPELMRVWIDTIFTGCLAYENLY